MGVVSLLSVFLGLWAVAEAQRRGFGGGNTQVNAFIQCGRQFCDLDRFQCQCPSPRQFGRNGLSRGQTQIIIVIVGNPNPRCRCVRRNRPPVFNPPIFNPPIGGGGGACGFRRGRPFFCNPRCQRCDTFNERCINRRRRGCRNGRPTRRFRNRPQRFFNRQFNRFTFDETNNSTLGFDETNNATFIEDFDEMLIVNGTQFDELRSNLTGDFDQLPAFQLLGMGLNGTLSMDQLANQTFVQNDEFSNFNQTFVQNDEFSAPFNFTGGMANDEFNNTQLFGMANDEFNRTAPFQGLTGFQ